MNHSELLITVFSHFAISGSLKDVTELNIGHLHTTLISTWETPLGEVSYVHQRINHNIFVDVDALMANMQAVIAHVKLKIGRGFGDEGERALSLVQTLTGNPYLKTKDGDFWRTYEYIQDSETYNECVDGEMAYAAARTFGRFQSYLIDLPRALIDPIPEFMNCERRLARCKQAVTQDSANRVKEARKEIEYIYENEELFSLIESGERRGELLKRATHGDMKLNNLLFSKSTKRPLCVVDLDTCMMGSFLFDFGDLVRVAGATSKEDEQDLSLVDLNLEYFEALTQGYGDSVRTHLNAREKEIAYMTPQLLALTVGTRFLTDYLEGDRYFKIEHAQHNLQRARCQLKLASSMKYRKNEMEKIARRALGV